MLMAHLRFLLFGAACFVFSACGTHDDSSESDLFCGYGQEMRDAGSEGTASIEIGAPGEDFRPFVDGETFVVSTSGSGSLGLQLNVHATGFLEYGTVDDDGPLTKLSVFFASDGAFAAGDFCARFDRYVDIGAAADSDLYEVARSIGLPGDDARFYSEPVTLVVEVLDVHGRYGRDEVTVNLQLP